MPEPTAVDDLLELMRDKTLSLRQRLNAAVSASRVERLQLPGEAPPESIKFLRWILDFRGQGGAQLDPAFRREAAAATAYYERRSKKNALQYDVVDLEERRRQWVRILNACLRHHLRQRGRPLRQEMLFALADEFAAPPCEPERALIVLLQPAGGQQRSHRRLRAIDDPGLPATATEAERHEIVRAIAGILQRRLAEVSDVRHTNGAAA